MGHHGTAEREHDAANRLSDRNRALIATTLIVALALIGWGVRWLTHPSRLTSVRDTTTVHVPVDRSVVVGMFAEPRHGHVRVSSATPRVTEDGTQADVRVLVCQGKRGAEPVGTVMATATQVCARVSDPHDAVIGRVSRGGRYLVLEVTPHRAGTLHVAGIDVEYSSGLRRGGQDSGTAVTVTATRARR